MTSVTSDFNLTRLNTEELTQHLRATIESSGNVFICAKRGTGKTSIAKQVIKEMGLQEIYLNASILERADFSYPNFFAAQKLLADGKPQYMTYLFPDFFKPLLEGDRKCVVLFDELDKASSEILAPLLEFIQFKSINGRKFPNYCSTIMTGNLISEGSQRPSLPLLDRAEKYLIDASSNLWLQWAAKDGRIHPSITAFIADNAEDLYADDDMGDMYASPSPRSWHNASLALQFGEEKKWAHSIMTSKVSGFVGKKVGLKYESYYQHYQVLLPIIDKIVKGEKITGFNDLEPSKKMVCTMISCSRLARAIDDITEKNKNDKDKRDKKELPPMTKHIAKYLDQVDPEITLISVRSQIGLERFMSSGLDEDPAFDRILTNLSQRIKG